MEDIFYMVNAKIAVRNIHNTNICLSLTNMKRFWNSLKDVSAENLRPSLFFHVFSSVFNIFSMFLPIFRLNLY